MKQRQVIVLALAALVSLAPAGVRAQVVPPAPQPQAAAPQPSQPPTDIGPVLRPIEIRIVPDNVFTVVPAETYLYYIRSRGSQPGSGTWVPYNDAVEQSLLADFDRLMATPFVEDLRIEVLDSPYPNGVMGKHVIFFIEERRRIKIVDYVGSREVTVSDIEARLKENNIEVRLDSPIDDSIIRRVAGVVKELYAEKGFQYATVTPTQRPAPGGPKLVHLTFNIEQGPKVKIRSVQFDGNSAVSDGDLRAQLKVNKPRGFLAFIGGGGTYQEAAYPEDAQALTMYLRNRGHVFAVVGQPQLEVIEDSDDGKTRWVQLRIPVDERDRYRVSKFEIAGNETFSSEALMTLFKKVEVGEYFDYNPIGKATEKLRELYGSFGFMDADAYPDLKANNVDPETGELIPGFTGTPEVEVTLRITEGTPFVLNRLTFLGNTTTRDSVIRREMRLVEGGVFNMESLKFSIRRLNQLGYFKPLEGDDSVQIEKVENAEGRVDVRLKFEEQNRNQLSFGAGVSQFEGFFGQLGFQTANFMGRGETLSVSAQKGSRARNYQLAFTEPFLFDRPITAGIDIYSRQVVYPFQFTQGSTGGNLIFGFPVGSWSRFFIGYSFEQIEVSADELYRNPLITAGNPILRESLLLDSNGKRTVSKISPSISYNTVNEPIFPTSGTRLTAAFDIAGIGGDTSFLRGRLESIFYRPLTPRMSIGIRAQTEYIRPYADTTTLPIFERLVMGGEYSIRGFDLRSVGTRDPQSGLVLGGNKTLLFNAEYMINVGGPVRLVFFYDAGQVRDLGERFRWKQDVLQRVAETPPLLSDPSQGDLVPGGEDPVVPRFESIGKSYAFKTSLGGELRFFMPVLNVPFRLIFAYNPQRQGIFNNSLQRQPKYTFRFAVGTTF